MDELDDLLNADDDAPPASPSKPTEEQPLGSDMDTEDGNLPDDQPHPQEGHEAPQSPIAEADEIDPKLALRSQQNQQCIELMSECQLDRYAAFRRSKLNQRGLKRLVSTATGKTLNADATIVLAGVSKMHVGEMVEKARELAEKRGNYGPLLPQDLRAAFAEISSTTSASNVHHRRRF